MSKVYSFRLDEDNPREARAKDVIDAWISQGYSLRHILTSALNEYRKNEKIDNGWGIIYDQLSDLVRGLEEGKRVKKTVGNNPNLSPSFISALKKSVKKGIVSE